MMGFLHNGQNSVADLHVCKGNNIMSVWWHIQAHGQFCDWVHAQEHNQDCMDAGMLQFMQLSLCKSTSAMGFWPHLLLHSCQEQSNGDSGVEGSAAIAHGPPIFHVCMCVLLPPKPNRTIKIYPLCSKSVHISVMQCTQSEQEFVTHKCLT